MSQWHCLLLLLLLSSNAIFAKDNSFQDENEKGHAETHKVKKIVLELDFLPTPVFQDVTEPKQQLHRVNRIEIFQSVDFEISGVHWLTLGDLQYTLLDSSWLSDGSSRDEFLNKLLKSTPLEKPGGGLNISDVEDMWKFEMSSVSGHSFECSIPPLRQTVDYSELSLRSLNLSAIMSEFNGTCFYRNDGWWTYEFCVGKHVKQYHLNPVTLEQEEVFYLGFPIEHKNNEEETDYNIATISTNEVDNNVVRIQYANGSLCHLTGSPRNVTVDFICPATYAPDMQASEYISSVREIGTCSYRLILASSALCSESLLRNHPRNEVEVVCKVKNDSVSKAITVTSLTKYRSSAWF